MSVCSRDSSKTCIYAGWTLAEGCAYIYIYYVFTYHMILYYVVQPLRIFCARVGRVRFPLYVRFPRKPFQVCSTTTTKVRRYTNRNLNRSHRYTRLCLYRSFIMFITTYISPQIALVTFQKPFNVFENIIYFHYFLHCILRFLIFTTHAHHFPKLNNIPSILIVWWTKICRGSPVPFPSAHLNSKHL